MRSRLGQLLVLVALLSVGTLLGSALTRFFSGDPDPVPAEAEELPGERIRVEVLNGGGTAGVAREATNALRDAGFDVVGYQNAANFSDRASVVIDRVGRPELARGVAAVLGIEGVESDPDSTRLLEVTVLLGTDWSPVEPTAGAETPRPWWDPRGYIRRSKR